MEKFDIIYADPPWQYKDRNSNGKRGADYKYDTMNIEDITSLPIYELAEDNSVLFLWCTAPLLNKGIETVYKWGFNYKTIAFTWVKLNKNGSVFKGLGHYTRSNAEFVLLGVRGKGLEVIDKSVSQIIQEQRSYHSVKPGRIKNEIDRLYPDPNYKRIELFARKGANTIEYAHWNFTGLEYNGAYIEDILENYRKESWCK